MTARTPGVPIIRTRLAWRRTGLSFAAVALLVARLALVSAGDWRAALAWVFVALSGCAVPLILVHRRLAGLARGDTSLRGRVLLLCAAITVGYAMLGGILMIL